MIYVMVQVMFKPMNIDLTLLILGHYIVDSFSLLRCLCFLPLSMSITINAPLIRLADDKSKRLLKGAIPPAAITRNAVSHACRHKRSDQICQIVHSYQTRQDVQPPLQEARSWCHQLSH